MPSELDSKHNTVCLWIVGQGMVGPLTAHMTFTDIHLYSLPQCTGVAVEAAPDCSAGVLLLLRLISPLHPAAFSAAQGLTGPTGMFKLSKLLGMAMATLAATTMAATTAATGHHHAEACSCPAVAAAAAATMRTVCWLAYLVGLLLRMIICVAHTMYMTSATHVFNKWTCA